MLFLDTSAAIQILSGNSSLENLIDRLNINEFGITTPSIFELYHGIYKLKFLKKNISNQKFEKLSKELETFIKQFNIYSLTENAANVGAKIHMQLKGKGQEIDIFDCLIAAIVMSSGFKEIITNNQDHFQRIEGLVLYSF
jgi:predicted nucleic acid-binding protein